RATGRVNVEMTLTDWISVGTRTQITQVNKDGVSPDFHWVYYSNPLVTPYDADGNLAINPWAGNQDIGNPLERILWENKDRSFQLITNNYLNIDLPLIMGLSYRLNTGIRTTFTESATYRGRNSTTGM